MLILVRVIGLGSGFEFDYEDEEESNDVVGRFALSRLRLHYSKLCGPPRVLALADCSASHLSNSSCETTLSVACMV